MLLPDLSTLWHTLRIGGPVTEEGSRSKRQRNNVNYKEHEDAEDTPLIASIERDELPGTLMISNKCFVETEGNVKMVANGGLLVVVTDQPATGSRKKYGGTDVVHFPFKDHKSESDETVMCAIKGAVASVKRHWEAKPHSAVLVHCNAGQNRSAAVLLAVLCAYGVPEGTATQLVEDTIHAEYMDGKRLQPYDRLDWDKFAGDNGLRLRQLVLSMYRNTSGHTDIPLCDSKDDSEDDSEDDAPLSTRLWRLQ